MEIPARFIRVSPSHRGVKSEDGWLEIDLRAIDLEGLSKIYVNLSDVARIKQKRDDAATLLDAWDSAFGKKGEDAENP
jgi:hypothetical protein